MALEMGEDHVGADCPLPAELLDHWLYMEYQGQCSLYWIYWHVIYILNNTIENVSKELYIKANLLNCSRIISEAISYHRSNEINS